jgi:hypothetical protein
MSDMTAASAVGTMPGVEAAAIIRAVRPAMWLAAGVAAGVSAAGFWNVRFMDGIGVAAFVSPLIGSFEGKASEFPSLGGGFGAVFAVASGLAATLTASSIATFTLLPMLVVAATRSGSRRHALRVPAIIAPVVGLVGALYGAFIGRMGQDGAAAFNTPAIRSAQSLVVFSVVGIAMLLWAAFDAGWLPPPAFLAQPTAKAAAAGVIVGAFTLGRPLAVFREFLLYAAQPGSVTYGAAVVAIHSLATIAVPLAMLCGAIAFSSTRLSARPSAHPRLLQSVTAATMGAGGAFLLFYWGITRIWPSLGRWGFQLGWYQ